MDIDIDLQRRFKPATIFPTVVRASMVQKDVLVPHPCGHYLQHVAVDSNTKLAAIPYSVAEDLGYFKFDFLHLSVLDHFNSKQEIRTLLKIEPEWQLLNDRKTVEKLFHIRQHYDLVNKISPTTIQELADCIALIRPGKKRLLHQYLNDKITIRNTELYTKSDDQYSFKRSHAISYAMTIVLQLHLVKLKVI